MRLTVHRRRISGFTLIELVTVITILAVLAAFAVPRFVDLRSSARTSTIQSMLGSTRSAASLAHSVYRVTQSAPNDPIQMEGQAITMFAGYPDGPGMLLAANLDLNNSFQTAVFGNFAFVVWATGTPGWTTCGFAYIRPIPPAFPQPRYFGPNTINCQ